MPLAALFVVQEAPGEGYPEIAAFQCRSRLCLWCKLVPEAFDILMPRFNAARGFVCGASSPCQLHTASAEVSMPLAALFVVQVVVDV